MVAGDLLVAKRSARWFWGTVVVSLGVKLFFAATLPLLGDEAYFVTWGMFPALGYYDHPPLVGWMLYGLLALGDHPAILRLPAVLTTTVLGIGLFYAWRREDVAAASLAASCYLLLPVNLIGTVILTDTPLILASGLSVFALAHAERTGLQRWYALSGALLGCAFLAKYFAVLLVLAYAGYYLLVPWTSTRKRGVSVALLAASPFLLFNLWWNATHCWVNVLFNLINRHVGEAPRRSGRNSVVFWVLTHVVMLGPVLGLFAVRWRRLREGFLDVRVRLFALVFAIPISTMLVGAAFGFYGAYWVLSFYPFLFAVMALALDRRDLRTAVALVVSYSLVLGGATAFLATRPIDWWEGNRLYRSMILMEEPSAVRAALEPFAGRYSVAALAYTPASLLSWATRRHVLVFGPGSHYARQDDFVTDFRRLDGADILLFSRRPLPRDEVDPYFRQVEYRQLEISGATFEIALAHELDYERYRDEVLVLVRDRYYTLPPWLPALGCPFAERYSLGQCR